jgi:hypothetical protein
MLRKRLDPSRNSLNRFFSRHGVIVADIGVQRLKVA